MFRNSLVAFLLLFGCATIDTHTDPPADWPDMTTHWHSVPTFELREACVPYQDPGTLIEACTLFYFSKGECHIWTNSDFPVPDYVIKHEYEHCKGRDHIGSTYLRDLWEKFKRDTQS